MMLLLIPLSLCSVYPWEFTAGASPELFLSEVKKCLETEKEYLPTDTPEALAHFEYMKNLSEPFWSLRRIPYRDCYGPFLENEFIRRYNKKPLSYFSPFIPLFVPWFGIMKDSVNKYPGSVKHIVDALRPDYLYLVFSECDYGFYSNGARPTPDFENVFVLSAGGMGHVAIPWIQCNMGPPKKRKYEHFISFCGNPRSAMERKVTLEAARGSFGNYLYEYRGGDWRQISENSMFGYAPRGIAVATYRTYELIRMETIPVIATTDVHWLPYHPALNWSKFAVLTNVAEMPRTSVRLRAMDLEELTQMRANLHKAHEEFFTWNSFFQHFDDWLMRNKSYFTCSKAYLTSFRRS